jgi:aminopeptidase YwaD
MTYIRNKKDDFSDIALNINIDGAGLNKGNTSYSLMDLPGKDSETTRSVFNKYPGLEEGTPWVQGDHSIFLQYGIPAIAITSKWLIDNLANQNITHTSKDNSSIVNLEKIVELSEAVSTLIRKL